MAWEISNNVGEYLNSCRDAALDNRYFNQFKQDPRYRQILEHVSFEEASMYGSLERQYPPTPGLGFGTLLLA